ncbi:MAG TPA: substrate-binding domain-containing protein [Gammaproteobacteria bacterium]|nr:substrate-binding domain-containing protein [Gammaproteobacteria bacterium]
MAFEFDIRWKFRDQGLEEIDPRIFDLLAAIRDKGSLRKAAEDTGLSYRHAWGLIRYWSERITRPIVLLEKGRGASLTRIGEKLLWAEQLLLSRLLPELRDISDQLNQEFSDLIAVDRRQSLRINASHDLAIAHLQELLLKSRAFDTDFHFRGSLESLRELANGRCDIAGFHFPKGGVGTRLAPLYRQWLDTGRHRLVHVSSRQQGLVLQKKNRRKIYGLQSLTRRSVRFINRQVDSGTRTIFDELIRQAGIRTTDIRGYADEEFTHVAVAALVASGSVDAGFGIKAAASRFGLHFIPLVEENYLLAMHRNLPGKTVTALEKILKSRTFKNHVRQLPGYDIEKIGNEINVDEIFANS